MKTLVCEDNSIARKTIAFTLIKAGHEVVEASDGDQGIAKLNSEEIDLVITDLNMPYTKGLELLRYINKKMEKKVPVIIITGITLEETRQHAKELGAKGYMTKPFDPAALLQMIRKVTEPKLC
jgi:two-component system chemotaxis response regulator CheY